MGDGDVGYNHCPYREVYGCNSTCSITPRDCSTFNFLSSVKISREKRMDLVRRNDFGGVEETVAS